MAPMITPDFNENPSLQPGTYPARVISCEMKTSQKGNPYLNWKFETETPDDASTNRKWIFAMTALTGKGAILLKSIIRATIEPEYEGGPIDTDKCIGCSLYVKVDKKLNQDGTESPYPVVLEVMPDPDSFDSYEGFGT